MKVITMYLPQFHRVKENDEWWGEGFTEWTTVKNAETIYKGQHQPHIPLHNNYYNLLDKQVMLWQADLMKKYGVDGQCFYHYWFKDGRKILEKPAENLLHWQEINMPFCFCWANETWARSWSRFSNANAWTSIYEIKEEKNDTGILLEQKYGDEEQWKKHFDYLFPFFRDNRYIKVNGCPVFVIYKSALIPCLNEMMDKWNVWAREQDFDGIYVIGANSNIRVEKCLDSILYHEPQYTIGRNKEIKHKDIFRLGYDDIWQELLSYQSMKENAIYGGFVSFDDTPRRGKIGTVIDNSTPEKFQHYLTELIAKNIVNGNELVFVNAWNEWGEGMHLEPDEKYQFGFLEAVLYAKEHYKEYLTKYERNETVINKSIEKEVQIWAEKSVRYEGYWRILDAWLNLKERNISLERYFIENDINSIGVYGVGMLGKHLINDLANGKVKVRYAIDRNADGINMNMDIYLPEDNFPESDMIVVTATYAFEDIKSQLQERGYKNIVSLEYIVMELI